MLPDISDALNGLTQPLTLIKIVQEIVDYKPTNVETTTTIDAVVQVADADKIKSDEVDLSKRYLQVHSKSEIKNIDECIYQGERYKAFLLNNYKDYGYYEAYFEDTKSA